MRRCPLCLENPEVEGLGRLWKGVKGYSDPQYFELRHTCKPFEDTFTQVSIIIRARTEDELAFAWNEVTHNSDYVRSCE